MVKTKGHEGADVYESNKITTVPSIKTANVVDTTGAGDMFAAGFLHKILDGKSPIEAASFGCKVASLIIEQYGARPTNEILQKL